MEAVMTNARLERPPIPREHGAWVMLYAPLVIAAASVRPKSLAVFLLVTLASTGIFLAQQALAQILRSFAHAQSGRLPGRTWAASSVAVGEDRSEGAVRYRAAIRTWWAVVRSHPAAPWLVLYLALALAGGVPLLISYGRWQLLLPGCAALALWGLHSLLRVWPRGRRWDRTVWGEAIGVTALGLTGPAVWIAATGSAAPEAWLIWAASVLYFSSSIFHVRMLLAAAKVKQPLTWNLRMKLAHHNLAYHGLLLALVVAWGLVVGGRPGLLGALAFGPGILRALYATVRLDTKLPPLKLLGVLETLYSSWFVVFFVWALAARQ